MTMYSDNKSHGFINNLWVEMGLLVVATVVVIALAAHYIW
jgi:hypothetical protein